jgi:hypothetical protein
VVRTNNVIGVLEWRDAQDGKWIHASTLLTTSLQPNDHAQQPWRDVPLSSCSMRTYCQLHSRELGQRKLTSGHPRCRLRNLLMLAVFSLYFQGQAKVLPSSLYYVRASEAGPALFSIHALPLFHSIGPLILIPPPVFFLGIEFPKWDLDLPIETGMIKYGTWCMNRLNPAKTYPCNMPESAF